MKKSLALVLALVLVFLSSAMAEEMYLDNTMRDPNLFNDYVCSYDDYFTIAFPDNWQFLVLSAEDMERGILEVAADDLTNPGMKVTICKYTPEECEEIFGGTGYDAIYSKISSVYSSVKSAKINNIWTIAYSEPREDSYKFILNFTTSEYVMYQIRFEFIDDEFIAVENNIIMSLESIE